MSAPTSSPRAPVHRKSAIAMLMVAGGLATAMPVQADPDPANTTIETANKAIIPCVKTKNRTLAPCVKTRIAPVAIAPCVKTKTGAIAPCVKTKTVVTAP